MKKNDQIWSKDGHQLGHAGHLFHRKGAADPALELYGQYLYVFSFEVGDDYYVPLDFISEDKRNGRFMLDMTIDEAMERGWSRLPDFIAKGESTREELPGA